MDFLELEAAFHKVERNSCWWLRCQSWIERFWTDLFFWKVMWEKIETLLEKFKRAKPKQTRTVNYILLWFPHKPTVHGQRSNCFDRMCWPALDMIAFSAVTLYKEKHYHDSVFNSQFVKGKRPSWRQFFATVNSNCF